MNLKLIKFIAICFCVAKFTVDCGYATIACNATVQLEIKQESILEREGFDARLKIINVSETLSIARGL